MPFLTDPTSTFWAPKTQSAPDPYGKLYAVEANQIRSALFDVHDPLAGTGSLPASLAVSGGIAAAMITVVAVVPTGTIVFGSGALRVSSSYDAVQALTISTSSNLYEGWLSSSLVFYVGATGNVALSGGFSSAGVISGTTGSFQSGAVQFLIATTISGTTAAFQSGTFQVLTGVNVSGTVGNFVSATLVNTLSSSYAEALVSGSSGTINAPTGRFVINALGATYTLTNSAVLAKSIVYIVPEVSSSVSPKFVSCTLGTASITFTGNPATPTTCSFIIFNGV